MSNRKKNQILKKRTASRLSNSVINYPRSLPTKKYPAPYFTFCDFHSVDKQSKRLNNSIKPNPYEESMVIDASDIINSTLSMMMKCQWICNVANVLIQSKADINDKAVVYTPPRYLTILKNINVTKFNLVITDKRDPDRVTLVDVKRIHAISENESSIVFFKPEYSSKPLIFPGEFLEDSYIILIFHDNDIFFFKFDKKYSSTETYNYIEDSTGISKKSYCHYVDFNPSYQRLSIEFDIGNKYVFLDMLY